MTHHPHPGDEASAEPGGMDEFDHAAAGSASTSGGEDAVNTELVNDGEQVAPAAAGATGPAGESSATAGAEASDAAAAAGPEHTEHPDTALAAQRLEDLQRLNAEYVNYKRRVDRDRAVTQERVVRDVLESLLPVLDDIQGARDHGELVDGPFAAIADKLEASLGKHGLERFGATGEAFDPTVHEALMHQAWPADGLGDVAVDPAQGTTVVMVLQAGYKAGEVVIRPARVAVADPE